MNPERQLLTAGPDPELCYRWGFGSPRGGLFPTYSPRRDGAELLGQGSRSPDTPGDSLVVREKGFEQWPEGAALGVVEPSQDEGAFCDSLGDLVALLDPLVGELEELDASVLSGDAFDQAAFLELVGEAGDVGPVAGQLFGQIPHGRRRGQHHDGTGQVHRQPQGAGHVGEVTAEDAVARFATSLGRPTS